MRIKVKDDDVDINMGCCSGQGCFSMLLGIISLIGVLWLLFHLGDVWTFIVK